MAIALPLAAFVVAILVLWRTVLRHHLQADFTGLWGAGRLQGQGQDPYTAPLYVDGAYFARSPYNYGPLVATLFRPLGALPYDTARRIWLAVQAIALVLLLWLALASLPAALIVATLLVALSPLVVFPVFAHLERGQIDLVIALGACASFTLWERGLDLTAGAVLALSAALKLPAVLLLLAPLAARDAQFLAGAAATATIVAVMALLVEGPARVARYFTVILPALDAGMGELPAHIYPHPPMTWPVHHWKQRAYRMATFDAGLASVTRRVRHRFGTTAGNLVAAAGLTMTAGAIATAFHRAPDDPNVRCLAWMAAVTAMLAFQPNTWIMGAVHLIAVGTLLPCIGLAGGVPAMWTAIAALVVVGLGDAVRLVPRSLRRLRPQIGITLLWGLLLVLLAWG